MASNPPGKCCVSGFAHNEKSIGNVEEFLGVRSYVTGSAPIEDKIIVIFSDIYGLSLENTKLVADKLASGGYKVVIPDILLNDPYPTLNAVESLPDWLVRHPVDDVKQFTDKFLKDLKSNYAPKFIGVIGYCFGARMAFHQIDAKKGLADACAVAHPSYVSMEEIEAIGNYPVLISAAETDPIFPPESRHATEDKLKEIGATYQIDLFSGVSHGFAVRGDLSVPAIRYAREKVIIDQLYFFDYYYKNK